MFSAIRTKTRQSFVDVRRAFIDIDGDRLEGDLVVIRYNFAQIEFKDIPFQKSLQSIIKLSIQIGDKFYSCLNCVIMDISHFPAKTRLSIVFDEPKFRSFKLKQSTPLSITFEGVDYDEITATLIEKTEDGFIFSTDPKNRSIFPGFETQAILESQKIGSFQSTLKITDAWATPSDIRFVVAFKDDRSQELIEEHLRKRPSKSKRSSKVVKLGGHNR